MKHLGVLAVVLLAAGCSSPAAPTPAPTVTVTTTATAQVTVTATPEPPAPPKGSLKLGATFKTQFANITVQKYDPSVSVAGGQEEIQTLLVKSCITHLTDDAPDGIGFTWTPWTLTGPDGSRYQPASDRWDHVGAQYPDDEDDLYQVGDCVKGVIQFDSTKTPATGARYRNGSGDTATWKF